MSFSVKAWMRSAQGNVPPDNKRSDMLRMKCNNSTKTDQKCNI